MNKFFTILGIFICAFSFAQTKKKNFNNIMKSQDIAEITEFLEQAHPDDPRKPVLKKRLIQLKNEAWTKGRETHKPMETRKIKVDSIETKPVATTPTTSTPSIDETKEFNELIALNASEHKTKSVNAINSLFDNDPSSKQAIVMVENKSSCNIIVRMEGEKGKKYRLPVLANNENSIVVDKDTYSFTSIVCGGQYSSKKEIQKPLMLTLQNPTQNTEQPKQTSTPAPKTKKKSKKK